MNLRTEWIAVDWGTSCLRAWAMQGETAVAQATVGQGMSTLAQADYEPVLLGLVADWIREDPVDVVACGMVGARQGWVEAPYTAVPAAPLLVPPITISNTDPRLRVQVVRGLKQNKPADVMRGEETQIAGFLTQNAGWDGVICLPGTHTKWVQISAGEVVSFRTFMTGELFALLGTKSILRHSIGRGWDRDAFAEGVDDTLSKPENLASRLFGLRARDLLEERDPDVTRAHLSGLLIGAELAAARAYWLGQQMAVIGAHELSESYASALQRQGAFVTQFDAEAMTLAGLVAARKLLKS